MKRILGVILVLAVAILCSRQAYSQHYYSCERAIPLKIDPGKVRVKFDDQLTDSLRDSLVVEISTLGKELAEPVHLDNFYSYHLSPGQIYDDVAGSLRGHDLIRFVEPYYTG